MSNIDPWIKVLERMKERVKERDKLRIEEIKNCKHDWKNDHDFVYDYCHQTCSKCKHKRMF
jgi:hypothetical protein